MCYAVTATVDGKTLDGYLLGSAHPAVAAFEAQVRTQGTLIPQAPPPAAAAPQPRPEPKPEPLSFADFHATGVHGERVDLSHERAANVVIYFWSPHNRTSMQNADGMESVFNTYHSRSVYMVGVATGISLAQLRSTCNENEIGWPQVLDNGAVAERYHVDPAKPYVLLDQARNVIAASATPGGLEPMLDELTKHRRPRL